mmetsp:Transcript_33518/g.66015  ORF Transcript_33518/g.66015 Transcript_33518/m.66015 type:complete len:82 (-) Transcript_33518:183-428(-)
MGVRVQDRPGGPSFWRRSALPDITRCCLSWVHIFMVVPLSLSTVPGAALALAALDIYMLDIQLLWGCSYVRDNFTFAAFQP